MIIYAQEEIGSDLLPGIGLGLCFDPTDVTLADGTTTTVDPSGAGGSVMTETGPARALANRRRSNGKAPNLVLALTFPPPGSTGYQRRASRGISTAVDLA